MNNQHSLEKSERILAKIVLAVLMLGVGLLSILALSGQSLRLDEAQSLWQSSHAPGRILYIVAQDVHVPLYHLLLHFWQVFFGNDVAVARYFSLIFALLTIPAVYKLGKIAYNRQIGVFAASMIALSPFLNWYANEIRMYSLLTLLTVLNYYFFIRIFKRQDNWAWWGFAFTALFGIYTHYFFFMALFVQALFFFFNRSKLDGGATRKFFTVATGLVISFLPWLLYVISLGSASNTKPQLIAPTSFDLFNTFSQFLFGFQADALNSAIISLWPVLVLFGFLSLRKNMQQLPETTFFFLTASLPIFAAFILSVTIRPLFLSRYLILAIPSLYLFISFTLSTYPHRLAQALRVLLLAGMATTLAVQTTSAFTPVKEHYREASEYIAKNATARDVVIISAPFTIYPVEYYYNGPTEINTLPIWNRLQVGSVPPYSAETLPQEVKQLQGNHQTAWLLLSYDQGYEEDVRIYFDKNYERIDKKTFSPGLELYVYTLRYDL